MLTSDQRQNFFRQKMIEWRADPVLFANEVMTADPDDWQIEGAYSVRDNPRTAIKSGQGVGKTAETSWILYWFLINFPRAKVIATAPTRRQLNDVLWSEAALWMSKAPLLQSMLDPTKTYIRMKGAEEIWFAAAVAAAKPENIQGNHADNMLFIIDEASGVDDPIFDAINGTLSGPNNKLLVLGNPTKASGRFYEAFTKDRALYYCITVDAEKSKRTNKENIAALKRKYGEDSNVVRVRVHGEFPTEEDDVFIPLSLAEQTVLNEFEDEPISRISFGVDVARFGDDETIIARKIGGPIDIPVVRKGQNLMQTVGDIVQLYRQTILEHPEYKGVILCVIDDTGLGGGVTDRLEEVKEELKLRRLVIVPVNFGSAPPQESEENYQNMSTYLWGVVRELMKSKEISIPNDDDTIGQFSVRKYSLNSKGKLVLESKEAMKKRGVSSPDRADAIALSCFTPKKVYNNFFDSADSIFITADEAKSKPIIQISIGIYIGNSVMGASMVATAITAGHQQAIVLMARNFPGEVETSTLGQQFYDLCAAIWEQYGKLNYVYCDDKEYFVYRCIKDTANLRNIPITVRAAADDDVNNRIRLTTRLMAQNRLFLTDSCEPLARAFSSAVWNEKKVQESRTDSVDTGILNAFEYTIEREGSRFISS